MSLLPRLCPLYLTNYYKDILRQCKSFYVIDFRWFKTNYSVRGIMWWYLITTIYFRIVEYGTQETQNKERQKAYF